ncbi:MAG: alpha/beta hydrolase [Oceanospirillaceae bacterium]|nr:alpha/beta hydrolase [Oceanospirillaceae bacterium]
MSVQNFLLKQYLRLHYKPRLNEQLTLQEARAEQDRVIERFLPLASIGVDIERTTLGGIECEYVLPRHRRPQARMLYLHGGMFSMGSPLSHRGITQVLAKRLQLQVVVPQYRLAPEAPCPAAHDDVTTVYRALRAELEPGTPCYVAGDQAGACLAFQLAQRQVEERGPVPDALIAISGLYDLTLSGPSLEFNAEADCFATRLAFERALDLYLGPEGETDRRACSPLFGELSGLPPVLLQVSDSEMLLDDSRRMAVALEAAGVAVELDIWKDVPSCWHLGAVALPEGREAIDRMAGFLKELSVN